MKKHQFVSGTVITCRYPMITEMIAQCGFAVLWLDMEHSAISPESHREIFKNP